VSTPINFCLPAIYRRSDYLGFDIGLNCHGLGLGVIGLGFAVSGLELYGLVNITG